MQLTGILHQLSEKEIVQQVEKAFRSNKTVVAVVKVVILKN